MLKQKRRRQEWVLRLALGLGCASVGSAAVWGQNTNLSNPYATQRLAANPATSVPVRDGKLGDPNAQLKYIDDTKIPAQADGIIRQLTTEEGQGIKKDELLIELDTRLAEAELEIAERQWESARTKAEDKSNIEYNTYSQKLADKQLELYRKLLDKGASSPIEYETKYLESQKARLALQVAQTQSTTDNLEARVNAAKQKAAMVQIELRKMTAPFNGVAAEVIKHQNDFVRVGEPIVRLVGMEKLNVVGRLLASDLTGPPHQLENAPATAIVTLSQAIPGRDAEEIRITGKLNFVSPVLTADGTYRVTMQIQNIQDGGSWVLREGMPTRLEVDTAGPR